MLAVTGVGMASPLGLDVVTSCAAARAGIRRSAAQDADVLVMDEESGTATPIVAHRVPLVSAGLFGTARLLQLALSALDDLKRAHPLEGRTLGFVLVSTTERHRTAWLEKRRQDPETQEAELEPEYRSLHAHQRRLHENLLPSIVERSGLVVGPRARRLVLGDQTGFVKALQQATTWLNDGTCDTCIVGGVDSLVDPRTFQAMGGLRLLRTPENPVGTIPGELACFLALERDNYTSARTVAKIDSFAETTGAANRIEEEDVNCAPLMDAMAAAGNGQRTDLAVVNLNGDTARANEWGTALVRRYSQGIVDDGTLWIPPLFFGEIGAATGPASVALLTQGWARGYAPSQRALVCLMEDGPARAAVAVSNPG